MHSDRQRILVAFPAAGGFAQQVGLAFHDRGALAAYVTAFAYREDGPIASVVAAMPSALRGRVEPQLRRRLVNLVPGALVEDHAFWEVIRTLAEKVGASPPVVDRIWDHLSHSFTRQLGRRLRSDTAAIYAYEYTALEAFLAAKTQGVATILDFPSLNSRQFEEIQRREKVNHPELRSRYDRYFESRFERRQARRDAEMGAADVIITNSSVTRNSHIAGGADPAKTFAVPCGAPPTVEAIPARLATGRRPLRVVWAGTFSIRKGAHYLMEGWRLLGASLDARVDVYGTITIPERLWKGAPDGFTFHGPVVQSVLFDAFDDADVLIFPTLSDGFGMVVTEAFARGLPVITTDQAGASDLVKSGVNGLVIPAADPHAIAAALRWCLDNPHGLAAMGPAALDTARQWQWSDYRHALREAVTTGLVRAGYPAPFAPKFGA